MDVLSVMLVALIVNLLIAILLLVIKAFDIEKSALVIPVVIFGGYNFGLLVAIGNLLYGGLK